MHLLTAENIGKAYTERQLLEAVNFSIEEGQKTGIIGVNGTGKSTLLKLILELEAPDSGRFLKKNGLKIGYLPQETAFEPEDTVMDYVFAGTSEAFEVMRAYAHAENGEVSPEAMTALVQKMDAMQLWQLESDAKTVLTQLGVGNTYAKIKTLSGGQRKRVALAGALVRPCDLLILDEPTNHLDNTTIEWLETYLQRFKGALLMITHDRYFLDRVCTQIFEIHRGTVYTYEGNYNVFLQKKAEREQLESAEATKKENLYRRELAWIQRGARARSTKQKARIERFETLKASMGQATDDEMDISFSGARLGRKIMEIENLSMAYGDKVLFEGFEYTAAKGDRIGILGANGIGKSTLLKIIAGEIEPTAGRIDVGDTVVFGFFTQDQMHMPAEMRAIDYIKEAGEYVRTAEGDRITASQMMERFLFDSTLQFMPIGKLSGGERRRLHLLRILMGDPNVLLLDEPTNDLDIQTLTILEDYLENFGGVVIVVSHDRYLLDKVCEKLFVIEDGRVVSYTGNYATYLDLKPAAVPVVEEKKAKPAERPVREKKLKMSFKEAREWGTIESDIAALESQIEEKAAALLKETTDYVKLQALTDEKEALEVALEEKMTRWMYLNDLNDAIEGEKV
ncbi:ABC-F family ATP-binding cassette domain-containing protein [Fusibacter sp. JL298sf-3]